MFGFYICIVFNEVTEMKKRRVNAKKRSLFIKMVTGVVIVAAVILFLVIMNSAKVKTNAGVNTGTKFYRSVMVEKGDTLWSIAKENVSPGQEDIRALVNEIKDINNLTRDEITYGANIIIPYYEDMH